MKRRIAGALCGILLCVLAGYLAQGENGQARILRPLDKSVLAPGPVEIAVVVPPGTDLPPITLDGQKLVPPLLSKEKVSPGERLANGVFHPPAFVVVRSPSPGLHEFRAGNSALQFFVRDMEGKKSPPKEWLDYAPHPPADPRSVTCAACHELGDDGRFTNMTSAFSMEKPTRCFDCHDRSEFSLTHTHRYETLAFCQMCHDPHGASGEHLLKIPQKKACTLCHD